MGALFSFAAARADEPSAADLKNPLPEAPKDEVPVAEASTPSRLKFELKGFLDGRYLYARDDQNYGLAGLLTSLPPDRAYVEANIQPSLHHDYFTLAADLSLYAATYSPTHLFLINEGYGELKLGPVHIHLGRQRIIWGSGLAVNPTDVLNPPKNPLDLQQQRTGVFYLPLVEVVTNTVTVSALMSPNISTNSWAIPTDFDFAHPWVGGRIYSLLLDTDANFIAYHDFKRHSTSWGASASRFFFERLELHIEGTFVYGPPSPSALPAQVQVALPLCGDGKSNDSTLSGALIAGGRFEWTDQTFLALEYLYNNAGLSGSDFDALRAALPCARNLAMAGTLPMVGEPNPIGHPIDPAIPLLRQHYLFLTFQRPHLTSDLFSDVSILAALIFGPEDRSTIGQLKIGYNFAGRATLEAGVVGWFGYTSGEVQLFPSRFIASANLHVSF